jgi:hypothetical protein
VGLEKIASDLRSLAKDLSPNTAATLLSPLVAFGLSRTTSADADRVADLLVRPRWSRRRSPVFIRNGAGSSRVNSPTTAAADRVLKFFRARLGLAA